MTTTMNGSCLGMRLAVLGRRRAELLELVADVAVVLVDVAHAFGGQRLVALLHLVHRPAQGVGGQLGLDDDGREQVRDVFVHPQLEPLGVDHDQPHVVGRRAVEDAGQHRVEADRLAGARGAGDEQVRHRRQVGEVRLAVDRLAQRERELAGRLAVDVRLEQLAQRDLLADVVGHLDADGGLARQPVDDDRLGLQRQAQVVGQPGDLAVLHAGVRLELEGRDDRARMDLHDRAFDRELAALLLEQPRAFHQLALVDLALDLGRVEQRQRRQRVAAHAALDRRARGGVALAERQRRRRGAASRLARGDGRRVRGPARRRGRRGRDVVFVIGRRCDVSCLRLGARGARGRQGHLCGLGRCGIGALLPGVLGNHLAALRLLPALLAPRAERSPPARAGAGAGLEGGRERSPERELRGQDHREHQQRDHDDDRAGAIEVGGGGAADPLARRTRRRGRCARRSPRCPARG